MVVRILDEIRDRFGSSLHEGETLGQFIQDLNGLAAIAQDIAAQIGHDKSLNDVFAVVDDSYDSDC